MQQNRIGREIMPRSTRRRSSSPSSKAMEVLDGFLNHPLGTTLATQVFDQLLPRDLVNLYESSRIMKNIFDEETGDYDELFPNQYWRIYVKRHFQNDYAWPFVEMRLINDFRKKEIHRLSLISFAAKIREDVRSGKASPLKEYKTNKCANVRVGGNWIVSSQPFVELGVREKIPTPPARVPVTGAPHFYEMVRPDCTIRKVEFPAITAFFDEMPISDFSFYFYDMWEPFLIVPGTKKTHCFCLDQTDPKTIKPVIIEHVSEVHSHLGYFTVKSKPKCDLRNGRKYLEKVELPVVYRHKGWYFIRVHEITPFTTKVVHEVKIGRDDMTEMFWEFRHEPNHEDKFEIYCGDYDNYFLFIYRKPHGEDSMDYLNDWDKKMLHFKLSTRKISEINVNDQDFFSNDTQFEFVNGKLFVVRESEMSTFFDDRQGNCYEVLAYTPNEENGVLDSIAGFERFQTPTKHDLQRYSNAVSGSWGKTRTTFVTRDVIVKDGYIYIYDNYSLAKNRMIKPKKRKLKKMFESHRKIPLEELYERASDPELDEDDLFHWTQNIDDDFFESNDFEMLDEFFSSEVMTYSREEIGRLKIFL